MVIIKMTQRKCLFYGLILMGLHIIKQFNSGFCQILANAILYYLAFQIDMSQLQALQIAGIRSYDPNKSQTITFQTPLTLIWGKNGCGKTTIIESLKYITTGAIPLDSDRGKGFIMNPKSGRENEEVHGDIRLKFKTVQGRQVMAIRKAVASYKKKSSDFKSIEQVLWTKDQNGQKIGITLNCGQFQKQLPQLLGISRPVLQKIVFCLQDDSLWPFSDSQNLKNLFDELFQTEKFSQILQALKDSIKSQNTELKMLKSRQQVLKNNYENTNELNAQLLQKVKNLRESGNKLISFKIQLAKKKKRDTQTVQHLQYNKLSFVQERGSINNQIKFILEEMKKHQNTKISVSSGYLELAQLQQQISRLEKQFKQIQLVYEDLQIGQLQKDKQQEIKRQIKKIKVMFPKISAARGQEEVINLLKEICKSLKQKYQQIISLKEQYKRLEIPSLPLPFKNEIEQEKLNQNLISQKNELNNLILTLQKGFLYIYKDISYNVQNPLLQGKNIQVQLMTIRQIIKMKQQQLQKYQLMLPLNKQLNRQNLKFAGIEMQQNFIQYIDTKQKCLFCLKPLTKQQAAKLKTKCEKRIQTTQEKLRQIQQAGTQNQIDPQFMAKQIKEYLQQAFKKEKDLQAKVQIYKTYNEQKLQSQKNKEIIKELKSINQTFPKKTNQNIKPLQMDIDQFKSFCSKFRILQGSIRNKDERLRELADKKNQVQQIRSYRAQKLKQKQRLEIQIGSLQKQIEYKPIAENVLVQFQNLIKIKPKNGSKSEDQNGSKKMLVKLQKIQQQINIKKVKQTKLKSQIQFSKLQDNKQHLLSQLKTLNEKIDDVENKIILERLQLKQYLNLKNDIDLITNQIKLTMKLLSSEIPSDQIQIYIQEQIKLRLNEISIQEMEVDYKCLQKARNMLHSQRMGDINQSINRIWKQIYQSSDIQSIQILFNTVDDAKKKKTYNYRIVMTKNGIQYDMKGRCSMGQKMMASIVIRLAISQAFAGSSRIITLDEPTTNLDRGHIRSLAEQLCSLIQFYHEHPFQLILISHDLQFIKLLKQYTTCYYEISKENQFSVIKKKEIGELFKQMQFEQQSAEQIY